MKALPPRYLASLISAIVLPLALSPAQSHAQRVSVPTAVEPESPFYNQQSPSATFSNQSPPATLQPGVAPASPGGFDPYADPATQPPSLNPYGGQALPPAGAPVGQPYVPPSTSPYAGIGQGNLAQPECAQPVYGQPLPDGTLVPRRRFLHEIHLDGTNIIRFGPHGLGITDVGLDTVFAWPILANPNPIYITPGFTYHSWNGPASGNFAGNPDLPPNAYDAYLDASWHPQITNWFSADLDVRVGVYSDFHAINSDSIRVLGRGLGIVTFSPQWQVAAGIWYLNRLTVQMLPAGGVIWTPNQDTRVAVLFPNPKISHRVFTVGNTDVWAYMAGEYGGGRWTIRRADGTDDIVELNDIRVLTGLEWFAFAGIRGNAEIGYVFDRHIIYRSGPPIAHPSDSVLFRLGLTY